MSNLKGRYNRSKKEYTMIEDTGVLIPPTQEPEYVKVYINTQLSLSNLTTEYAKYIIAFARHMNYANDPHYSHTVDTHITSKEDVARICKVTVARVDQVIKELVKAGVFIKIVKHEEKDGVIKETTRKGVYFVNPYFIAKGDWPSIRNLQQNINWKSGECELIVEDKTLKAHMPVAIDPPVQYHQLTMAEYLEDDQKQE